MTTRCAWCGTDPLYVGYHDLEWGVPLHDDRGLFELLTLEGAQAGLSWITVLRKRARYRQVFAGFEAAKIARFRPAKIEKLLLDPGIIRNRAKVEGTVSGARTYLEIVKEFGSFDRYLWQFTGGRTIQNQWRSLKEIPPETAESRAMSKALKERGFKFVGPTICYAFMQAAGMVNDHTLDCFRYSEVSHLAMI
ncbi:MAG: DNA-3-methyladenine glycosylase I [Bryobacterales bacterium]|nr:DNA-3-methyladenine glycosylase I [Bryobacterales bacterium]